jgi:hypothetical protein
MNSFISLGANREGLLTLNRCHLYLQAYFISDLIDGSGEYSLDDAWNGQPQSVPFKEDSWPKQGNPPKKDWIIWQSFSKQCFLSRGRRLKTPLGPWRQLDEKWPWYFSPYVQEILPRLA